MFPKKFMTITELVGMGIPENTLRELYHSVGHPLAFKVNANTSPIIFNTKLLDKRLQKLNERRE